jgi:hypothetical protein
VTGCTTIDRPTAVRGTATVNHPASPGNDLAVPDTADSSPEAADAAQPEVTDAAQPEVADAAQPEVADSSPEVADAAPETADGVEQESSQPEKAEGVDRVATLSTGDATVDHALERLSELDERDLREHAALYDDIHQELRRALDAAGE